MESPYDKIKDGFKQICKREVGLSHPRKFSRRFSSSQMLVEKVNLYGKLVGHQGCVNAVEFNSTGELLVSGSDDKQVIFWDWATTSKTLSYPSGHFDNIFQTKIMPFSADRKIVTSASDGQVRLGQVLENGRVDTKRLGKHQGRVYKLAVEPGSPHIVYSCGEDGLVQHFDLRSRSATRLFYCSSFAEHSKQPPSHIRLNGIVFDPRNPNYFAVGGSDAYARVYDLRNCQWNASNDSDRPINAFCPHHLCESNTVNITGLAFSCTSELLVSYNDELIYLFQKDMGRGSSPLEISASELKKLEQPQVYVGHRNSETIKGVNFYGPNDEFVLSGSDCGHIFIWKKHGAKLVRVMHGDRHIVNQLEPHPHLPMFATCGIEKNVKLWVPMASEAPPLPENLETIIESNKQGREDSAQIILTPDVIMHVLRLQRRQMLAYAERSHNVSDTERHEEEEASYILGFPDSDDASEEGSESNPGECNID